MERRVLVAIFLSFLVLYVYQTYVVKPVPKTARTTVAGAPGVAGAAATDGAPAGAAAASAALPEAPPATEASALVGEASERDIRVETRDVIAVFTNRGARLKSWRLKKFLDKERQPQELVEHELPMQPLPFTLATGDEKLDRTLNGALYAVSEPPSGPITAPGDLRFEYRDSLGVHAVKEFRLTPDSYVVTFRPKSHRVSAPSTRQSCGVRLSATSLKSADTCNPPKGCSSPPAARCSGWR